MFYEEVLHSLHNSEVRYLLVGGIAVNLHGVPRATYDMDLMIALDELNIRSLWSMLTSSGFRPSVPIDVSDFIDNNRRKIWREQKNMLVLSFVRQEKPFHAIDVFTENPVDFEQCYQRRKIVYAKDVPISLMNIDDLIHIKSLGNRQQDLDDITSLTRVKEKSRG